MARKSPGRLSLGRCGYIAVRPLIRCRRVMSGEHGGLFGPELDGLDKACEMVRQIQERGR